MRGMTEESTARGANAGEGIALPTPTAWPMLFALGLSMLFAGLVTHPVVSGVGAVLFLRGAIGWWFEVLPHERHEQVPLQPEAERPAPIQPRTAAVEHLRAGEGRHRLRLPIEIQPYSAGLRGGAAGAVAMAVVAMAYGVIAEASVWYPINLLASAVLPAMNLADTQQLRAFSASAFGVATLLHGGLSLMVGLVYAALLPALPGRTLLWGGIVAPLAWTGVAWASLGLVAPALNDHIEWRWFIASQAAFGLTAGWVISKVEPIAVLQRLPLAAKAGIEAKGVTAPRSEDESG
jgi:hypothetical protein